MTSIGVESVAQPGTFSLVSGGPFNRLLGWLGLCDPELRQVARRCLAIAALTWMPLLLLSMLDGRAFGGAALPFLHDVEMASRLLVALPLLFAAEWLVHRRFPQSIGRFRERGLIPPGQEDSFDRLLEQARRAVVAPRLELALLVLVYAVGFFGVWRNVSDLGVDSWYVSVVDGVRSPRPAGWWLALVSLPLFQFVLLRWYFRMAVWWWFLWRLSRLDLRLQPLHPDRAGGLGFLAQLALAFTPLLMAQGVMAAAWIANRIVAHGAQLPEYRLDLLAAAVVTVLMVLGPLAFFAPMLSEAKRTGLSRYGLLSSRYAQDFERRWLRGPVGADDSPIGSSDIQSLADLGNAYANLKQMRVLPFGSRTALQLGIAMAAPVAPLLLTMVSVDELVRRVIQFLL